MKLQRPVFYSIASSSWRICDFHIAVRGRAALQADGLTVSFALLGALLFSMSSDRCWQGGISQGRQRVAQPAHGVADQSLRLVLGIAIRWRWITLAAALLTLTGACLPEP